jgi:hypothetical protein
VRVKRGAQGEGKVREGRGEGLIGKLPLPHMKSHSLDPLSLQIGFFLFPPLPFRKRAQGEGKKGGGSR